MLWSMAWRNLWRNPRRTLLTLGAVAGGLAMMLAMYGMMRAMGDRLIEGLTGSFMGHVQIHREGYRENRSTTRTVGAASSVLEAVRETEGVEAAAGRIYGFAHATFVRGDDEEVRAGQGQDVASPVVALLGLDPEHEQGVTDLSERIVKGRGHWLEKRTDVVIGEGVAQRHEVKVGDAFLPTAVDTTGAMRGPWAVSDEVPRVAGIVRTGVEKMDDQMVMLPLSYLSDLLRLEDEVHEIAIRGEQPRELDPLVGRIEASVDQARSQARRSEPLPATKALEIAPDGGSEGEGEGEGDGEGETARVRLVGVEAVLTSEGPSDRTEGLARGRFLSKAEEIVLAGPLARKLGVGPGDRVKVSVPVFCGEDVPAEQCPPSQEPFVVAGVLDGEEVLDGRLGLVANTVVTDNVAALAPQVAVELTEAERDAMLPVLQRARGELAETDEVMAWYELAPEMKQMMQMMDIGPLIFLVIFYIAVMLGIVNTMLMATFERTKELGLMMALGMRPRKVVTLVMAESVLMALVGVALGVLLGLAIVWYWSVYGLDMGALMGERGSFDISGITFDPVLWPRVAVQDVVLSSVTVAALTSLSGLWPAIRASRLRPTEALRHE